MINTYQRYLSPLLGPHCRFTPSCSEYAKQAIQRFGLMKGLLLFLKRFVKCQPLCQGGHDPVPPIKMEK